MLPSPISHGEHVSLHVVLDFDGTITEKDTIAVLAEIAITHQNPPNQEKQNQWSQIVKSYTTDLNHHHQIFPNQTIGSLERTPSQEACLTSLTAIEHRSINRVNASKIFQGIDTDILQKGAEDALANGKVVVREEFKEFVEKVCGDGGKVGILSVNWSREWIRSVIGSVGVNAGMEGNDGGGNEGGDSGSGGITIMANHIDASTGEIVGPPITLGWPIPTSIPDSKVSKSDESDTNPESKGKIEGKKQIMDLITTAKCKLNALKILQHRSQHPPYIPPPHTTPDPTRIRTPSRLIYIADSLTDLDCILVADLAIVMVSESTQALKEELVGMGYEWKFVGEIGKGWGREMDERMLEGGRMGREKVVFWARSFGDVLRGGGGALFRG